MVDVKPVSRSLYNEMLYRYRDDNQEMAAFITIPIADGDVECYLTYDENAGFAITDDNELVGVFNDGQSGRGSELISLAVEYGADNLNCFDTKLVDIYRDHGFEVVDRIEWDEQYAPENWNYEKFGRPDVVIMELRD